MKLSDLTAYAEKKYLMTEKRKWIGFSRFSVLCDPHTGTWAVLLMRQWDENAGEEVELCDIKCGVRTLSEISKPYLSGPYRMRGPQWVGVRMGPGTETDVVCGLLDRAVQSEKERGYAVVLEEKPAAGAAGYRDTPLPPRPSAPSGASAQPSASSALHGLPFLSRQKDVPERIRKMRRMYPDAGSSFQQQCRTFYLQAMYMQDYEDDFPCDTVPPMRFFPSYLQMTIPELRGYFTWRTQVRRGNYKPAASSYVYLYLNELVNRIGAESVQDSLKQMRAFEKAYLDAGYGDLKQSLTLRRWMQDLAVMYGLHPEETRQYADPAVLERDGAMAVLSAPQRHGDDEVFSALRTMAGGKWADSPAYEKNAEKGKGLLARAWRAGCEPKEKEENLFAQCFGEMVWQSWYPLSGALYLERRKLPYVRYQLDACRTYLCRNGKWQVYCYSTLSFRREHFYSFLREADRQLRLYLKAGRPLKERRETAWAGPLIAGVLEKDRREKAEAARPKIVLDLSDLDRIRRDAQVTRDSLLTEEETREGESAPSFPPEPPSALSAQDLGDQALDPVEMQALRELLAGGDPEKTIRDSRRMPSLVMDRINETFYAFIGDNVLAEEDGRLMLVEDYIEDVQRLLGGSQNE